MLGTTFIPLMSAMLYRAEGFSSTGRVLLSKGEKIKIAPVKFETAFAQTSIRTDKSGSQSRAEEATFSGRVLVHPDTTIESGDIMEVFGIKHKVQSVFPRFEMNGILHHYQVDLVAWQG